MKSSTIQVAQRIGKDGKDGDKVEKRLWDEVEKLFSQSESFYFSPTIDLTNSILKLGDNCSSQGCSWQSANSRFFWNKLLLKDLIDLKVVFKHSQGHVKLAM